MVFETTGCPYWKPDFLRAVDEAATFDEVARVALAVLKTMPKPDGVGISQLCGPLSTGGLGSLEKNGPVFTRCVECLRAWGFNPFDQTPLQSAFIRLAEEWRQQNGDAYCMPIIEVVYRRIFESGHITTTYFLPHWGQSFVATRERRIVMGLRRIKIERFDNLAYNEIVDALSTRAVT